MKKSRVQIQEVPACPNCKCNTDRTCKSQLENQNGNGKVLTAVWTCEKCQTKYTSSLKLEQSLDNEE